MNRKDKLRKFSRFAVLVLTGCVSLWLSLTLRNVDILVRGYLSIAVLYYVYRTTFNLIRKDKNIPLDQEFPRNFRDIISTFFLFTTIFLAFAQLGIVFTWLVKWLVKVY